MGVNEDGSNLEVYIWTSVLAEDWSLQELSVPEIVPQVSRMAKQA